MIKESPIVEKIRKLLAKANGTTNANEAAAFLGKAQALQLQHRIDMMELRYVEEVCQIQSEPLNQQDLGKRSVARWKGFLANVLAEANGCYMYADGEKIMLAGKSSDCDTVRYLYAYCVNQIDALVYSLESGLGRTYYNNFRIGCVQAISSAITSETALMREHHNANERALMMLNQVAVDHETARRLVTSTMSISTSATRSRLDKEAQKLGREAGSSIYNRSNVRIGNQRLLE